ncbi:hypothetical protein LWC34_28485 [Kibdelosporangium philippinense]|uniref:Plasmid replication, integration and excision activator n=1 Tax=Kibdelosporangium philippinense TaxID=211113 RepID=A0ABS8ZFY3_9PSEU|nr:hypothetical protein [Kibdelosporangium philippinense]MCE7006735.1 hypothetical protein [Kibdelosporangium philippinense]
MAIAKGYRFEIPFDLAFPKGLVLVGDVVPDTEYQSQQDRASGRPVRQRNDDVTGLRQWKATVTDPDQPNAKRASFEIVFTADHQPVPTTTEVLPGMRPIELEGLTAEPKVAGNGEFKYLSYTFRATGFKAAAASGGRGSGKAPGPDTSKSAAA